jgi:hypothetical protein
MEIVAGGVATLKNLGHTKEAVGSKDVIEWRTARIKPLHPAVVG